MTAKADIARIQAAAPISGAVDGDIAGDFVKFLVAKLPELAAEFAALPADPAEPATALPAWMCDMAAGEILTTNDAAIVCGVETSQAVRYRCKRAEEAGFAIAIYVGGAVLISLRLLINDIERTDGLPARLIAESAAKKLPKFGSKQKINLQSDQNFA
jgi:hypothetical protein